jgi:hypothetical protein
MLNLAGPSYDYGNVLFAVLQECEHQRRALLPNEAAARLAEIAREKLAAIRASYEERGGTPGYWSRLEREVLATALPQYVPAALEQNRLEKTRYDLWRQGDPAARALFGLLGLVLGGLIIAAPFIPIFEDTFAFLLTLAGLLYPEIKKGFHDIRHAQLLNRLIKQAERYQKSEPAQYVTEAEIAAELGAVETGPTRVADSAPAASAAPPQPQRESARR